MNGRTLLHAAALAGDTAALQQQLHDAALPVDAWDAEGNSALMLACAAGHEEAVQLLLAAGADAAWRRANGQTALNIAVEHGHTGIVRRLLTTAGGRRAIQLGNKGGRSVFTGSPLNDAAAAGHADIARLLIEAGANVEGSRMDTWTPLMVAARHNSPEVAAVLLEAGADIEATDCQGGTALYLAAEEGQSDMVRWLAEHGADVNRADENGMTPLHAAALCTTERTTEDIIRITRFGATPPHPGSCIPEDGRPEDTVAALLEFGANPHAVDGEGRPPLHYAALQGAEQSVLALLAAGAKADALSPEDAATPLSGACSNGHAAIVDTLLAHGANEHQCSPDGRSMLHAAVFGGNEAIIRRLLEMGLSPDAEDAFGRSPLFDAASRCSFEVFQLLLSYSKHDAPERLRCAGDGRPLLHQAACNDEPETLAYLLARGADPLAEDEHGQQALNLTASNSPESVRLLLEAGADANHPGYGGRPPLHSAVYADDAENLHLLLAAGARVNEQEPESLYTALHVAALCYADDMAEPLLAAGADLHLVDSLGNDALHNACIGGKADTIRCLLAHGADMHATNGDGLTALCKAVEQDEPEAVSTLLAAGAPPNERDANGKTPLHYALEDEHAPQIVALLAEAGANLNAQVTASGGTALLQALRAGNRAVALALLSLGASAAPADCRGWTALHEVVKDNNPELVPALLRAGGHPKARDNKGITPLSLARSKAMRASLSATPTRP